MKANEAPDFPEKVYIPRDPESPQSPNIWWEREPSESNIEYTRTEVFIDKAEEWLNEHIFDYVYAKEWGQGLGIEGELFDDFRNAMKGE